MHGRPRHQHFGVVLGVGGAFAVTAWYDDNPLFAAILAAATIVAALAVYLRVDRRKRRVQR